MRSAKIPPIIDVGLPPGPMTEARALALGVLIETVGAGSTAEALCAARFPAEGELTLELAARCYSESAPGSWERGAWLGILADVPRLRRICDREARREARRYARDAARGGP